MTLWATIARQIGETTGQPFAPRSPCRVGGGCINRAYTLEEGERRYFVKCNRASLLDMFEAEAAGLRALAATRSLRVPQPLCWGTAGEEAYLVMEQVEMGGRGDEARAGAALAQLHRETGERFGWWRDNTIGATTQPNGWMEEWIPFWQQRRLGYQLHLAAENGYGGALQQRGSLLLERLPALITHHPQPALLHGDLWGGNLAYARNGEAVIFDPAVYYGDAEADLAMTELFGGFSDRFYAAYREAHPLDPGYATRKTLYNLYHVLNHLNLFGGSYASRALAMTNQLLAAVGH